jgi:hypothetical protein
MDQGRSQKDDGKFGNDAQGGGKSGANISLTELQENETPRVYWIRRSGIAGSVSG